MDELALISKLRARIQCDDARITLGIGDDAAILAPMQRGAVLSVDVAVEGVHFDRRWLSLEDAGFRGYVAALSDLAAMGSTPTAGLLSMIVPEGVEDDEVLRMIDGARRAADTYGAPIVGGNLSSGAQLAMSTTVIGEAAERPLLRDGASVGEAVYVTGTVGAAALGMTLLARGEAAIPATEVFIARWRRPRPRFDCVAPLLAAASSAIDVSDGLLSDLEHLCRASGVGATIETARLPLESGHDATAARLGVDGDALALTGGEDYEILFTARDGSVRPSIATRIGEIQAGEEVRVLDRGGSPRALERRGYRHR